MKTRALLSTVLLLAPLGVLIAQPAGAATPACSVVEQLTSTTGGFGFVGGAADGDGSRVTFRSNHNLTGGNTDHNPEIFLVDRDADTTTQVTNTTGGIALSAPEISDDGNRITFSSDMNLGSNPDTNEQIWVYTVSGGTLNQRTSITGSFGAEDPDISGDGTRVSFSSGANLTGGNSDGGAEVFTVNATGTPSFAQLTSSASDLVGSVEPAINQTGNRIAFISNANLVPGTGNADGNNELFVVDPAGPTIVQLTTTTGDESADRPAINDGGTTVVFESAEDLTGDNGDGNTELFRRLVAGGTTQLTDTASGVNLAPQLDGAGTRLAFDSDSTEHPGADTPVNRDLYVSDLSPTGIGAATESSINNAASEPEISDDGQVLAFKSDGNFLGTNADGSSEMWAAQCGPLTPIFSDVTTSNVFFGPIQWMAEVEIASGFPNGTFRPQDPVKRQQMANFLYNLAGQPLFVPPGSPTFSDVPTSNVFYAQVEWMADEGVASGFPNGTFLPQDAVKRQQMANFMHNFAVFVGVGL